MKKRIDWADTYKGIGIILMVLGHTTTILGPFIYIFLMSSFFLVSGFLTNFNKDNFIDFFRKKVKALIIPFYIVNLFFYLCRFSMANIGIEKYFYNDTLNINNIFLFFENFITVDLGGATWFLPVLFTSLVLYKLLIDVFKNNRLKSGVSCVILALVGYIYFNIKEILPYYIDLSFLAMLFILIGDMFKNVINKISIKVNFMILSMSLLSYMIFYKYFWSFINWPTRSFPNIYFMLIASLSGSYLLFTISKLLSNNKTIVRVFKYVNERSLYILMFHFVGFRILFTLLYKLKIVDSLQLKSLVPIYNNFGLSILTVVFAILFCILLYNFKKIILDNIKIMADNVSKNNHKCKLIDSIYAINLSNFSSKSREIVKDKITIKEETSTLEKPI